MKEWSWTCLLLRIGERNFSPGFTAPKLLEMRYNMVRRAPTPLFSPVKHLCHAC